MNYLDIILAIPLLWAIYKGFTKGLIFTVASLVALILGVYGSIHFSIFFEEYVIRWFNPSEKYLSVISFSLCFLIIVIVVHLLAYFIDRLVKAVALGMINRLAGVVFNIIKVAFILSIILSVFNTFNRYGGLIPEEDRSESILYKPVSSFAPAVFPYLKFDDIQQRFRK
jgi:membrane protein required for colicin V production